MSAENDKVTPGPWKDGPVFGKEGRAIFFDDASKPGKWQRRLDDKSGVFSAADAKLLASAPTLAAELAKLREDYAECAKELGDLFALVMGECRSLLDEDSGGSGEQYCRIETALSKAKGRAG